GVAHQELVVGFPDGIDIGRQLHRALIRSDGVDEKLVFFEEACKDQVIQGRLAIHNSKNVVKFLLNRLLLRGGESFDKMLIRNKRWIVAGGNFNEYSTLLRQCSIFQIKRKRSLRRFNPRQYVIKHIT